MTTTAGEKEERSEKLGPFLPMVCQFSDSYRGPFILSKYTVLISNLES